VYQIGDDWHILGKVEHLLTLAQSLQSCMRTKGMRDSLVFILGRYNHYRDPDHIVSFVMPRIMKSVPSATQNTFNTPELTIQDRNVPVYITPAQAMGAKDFIDRYGDTLFMEIDPATMRSFIQNPGERGYQHIQEYLAEIGGISEFAVQVQAGGNLLEDAGSDE